MGHAADLGDTEFKAGLVATKIIADQFALPILQKVAGVFSGIRPANTPSWPRRQRR